MIDSIIDLVIPALNEEGAIGKVLGDIPKQLVRNIVVADNGSSDNTGLVAKEHGAIVVTEPAKGYGAACLAGLERLRKTSPSPDIVVFLDADYSDHPDQLPLLVAPIVRGESDLVIGSRSLGSREPGAMMPQQVFGNKLATFLMRLLYGGKFTDLGPFRAIRWDALQQINMQDRDFGWTVEMQVKVLKLKLRYTEIPVSYRKRTGTSKITGTIKGTVMAGYKIILTILRYA